MPANSPVFLVLMGRFYGLCKWCVIKRTGCVEMTVYYVEAKFYDIVKNCHCERIVIKLRLFLGEKGSTNAVKITSMLNLSVKYCSQSLSVYPQQGE